MSWSADLRAQVLADQREAAWLKGGKAPEPRLIEVSAHLEERAHYKLGRRRLVTARGDRDSRLEG